LLLDGDFDGDIHDDTHLRDVSQKSAGSGWHYAYW
jgi:hypothetical protein